MKNLKRALALALSSIMLVGMMAVGAGAAGFGDADKIQNTEAVNTMVALGVIKGDDKGNFDPERTVTRAEMTKMICVALNGGKDPNLSGGGLYPDTQKHWASGYIDYCTNVGIVSGDNHGNFNPDKTITGTEAAKMILIALGFNAQNEKYVNDANWALNINVDASAKGLYDDVAVLPAAGLSRDDAAQMLYNGMDAEMVEYEYQLNTVDGNLVSVAIAKDRGPAYTIFLQKFDLQHGYSYMTGVSYDADKAEYTYTLSSAANFGSNAITGTEAYTANVKSTEDYSDLFGKQVKTLYKLANGKTTVYGIYAYDSSVLATSVVGELGTIAAGDDSVKIDGVTYDLTDTAATTPVFAYNNGATGETLNSFNAASGAYAFDLVDNTGDGKGDAVVLYPVTVAKVSFVGKESISASANKTTTSYKYEDNNIAEGLAKNDWVLITADIEADNTITALEAVSGTVEATRDGEVKIDGTWYKTEKDTSSTTFDLGGEYELIVVNGYIFNAKEVSAVTNVENAVYVLKADSIGTGTKEGTQEARLLFADGSKKVITVVEVNGEDVDGTHKAVDNTIYTYAVNKSGDYKLTEIDAKDFDANGTVSSKNIKDGKVTTNKGTFRFADDAVIFVTATKDGKSETKVVSGKVINDWAEHTVSTANLYANEKNGFNVAALGSMTLTDVSSVPGVDGEESFGWITGKPYVVEIDDTKYVEMTIWTVDGEKTMRVEGNKASDYVKGTPISFKDLGENEIDTVVSLAAKADAVTGYAGDKDIDFMFAGNAEIDKDTEILYVDTKENKGVEGGEISVADKNEDDAYIMNVYVSVAGDNTVDCIIVDVNNKLDGVADVDLGGTPTIDQVNAALATGESVNLKASLTLKKGETITVPAGKTLKGLENVVLGAGKVEVGAGSTVTYGEYTVIGNDGLDVTEGTVSIVKKDYAEDDQDGMTITIPAGTKATIEGPCFDNDGGTAYRVAKRDGLVVAGDLTLGFNTTVAGELTVNEGGKLTVNKDVTLLIGTGKTVTNNGTIQNNGTINLKTGASISGNAVKGNAANQLGA